MAMQVRRSGRASNLGDYGSSTITEAERKAIVHAASQREFQKFVSNNGGWLSSEDLLAILRTCPTMRVLECGHDRYLTITTMELTRQPWPCKWLKVLHLIISGIPRPDIKTDARDQLIPTGTLLCTGSMEESRILQRKVCAQLGALVCLEELCLGYSLARDMVTKTNNNDDNNSDNDDQAIKKYNPFLQLTCLELTLESGLDLLSDLKSLVFFSLWDGPPDREGAVLDAAELAFFPQGVWAVPASVPRVYEAFLDLTPLLASVKSSSALCDFSSSSC